ncbi:P-loop containing nucleoside triphosphate hydrolase protein [Xylariales sp. PMI_506]|nr:P-loop containing nucleoside triphosphate hydrolase protein [Xylariales sp. PMI_506]
MLTFLSSLEHSRTIPPSLVIQAFLFFTSLLDVVRIRTQWLLVQKSSVIPSLVSVALALKLVLLGLESIPKLAFSGKAGSRVPPLETAGIFGHSLLLWVNPLLRIGYSRDLTLADLFPLEEDLDGRLLTDRLARVWQTANKKSKHCLSTATLVTFIPEILITWIPQGLNIAFTMAQPFLVQTMLNYISNYEEHPISYGYGLIGAAGLIYIGVGITNQLYTFLSFRLMVKVRGALVGIIYRNMLTLRAESKNSASALSLMSVEVDRVVLTGRMIVAFVPSLVQVALAMGILGTQIGAVCIAPFIVAALCGIATVYFSKLVPPRQRKWMAAIQKRTGITADILGTMKEVKMVGIRDPVTTQVQDLRDFELAESRKFRKIQILIIALNIVPVVTMSAVTFTVYAIVAKVSGTGSLGISKAFTSLTLLSILINPVGQLVGSLTRAAQAMASLDRIQDFMLLEKRDDFRETGVMSYQDGNASFSSEKCLIRVRDASFGWSPKEEAEKSTIKDINLDVFASTLTLVIGPVASGKSTLLKSLLSETYLHSGSVQIGDVENVAYCDQDAWILNTPIRENIVGFSNYEEDFYRTVIRACQLEEDLSHLAEGDMSRVGSQGISLSGGQRQRIALARAVYSRKKLVVFDDPMRGLDADTSSRCFEALLGKNGLLRQNGIAVIMATHNAQWIPYADQLVVLGGDGGIANIGSFDSLRDTDYIIGLEASFHQQNRSKESSDADVSETPEEPATPKQSDHPTALEKTELSKPSTIDPVKAKPPKGRGNMNSSLPYYLKSLFGVAYVIFMTLMVTQVGLWVIQPLWLNFWTSANEGNPNEDPSKWVGIYVLFSVLTLVFMISEFSIFLLTIVPKSARSLHWQILKVAMNAPMSYFVKTDIGEIVNRFSQDMTLVDLPLPVSLLTTSEQAIASIGSLILTCISSGYMAICIPVLLVVLFYIQKFYLHTSRQLRLLELGAKSPLYSYFISSFTGLTTMRAFFWTTLSYDEHLRRLDTSQKPFYMLYCVQRWLNLVLDLAVAALSVTLMGISVALRSRIAAGLLGVAMNSTINFGQTLTVVIQLWTELETSLGAITRIREFVGSTPQEEGGRSLPAPPPGWPQRGEIVVSGLSATYDDRTVLDGVNLNIRAGEKVALCGRSGSGKSTLLALLLRMYEPAGGSITIDGVDITSINVGALRESLVALPQDPMLLAGTVRYNLDPAARPGGGDAELLAALEKTGLRTVIAEKGGLDAELNRDWLSGGQKQLFCLARTLLRTSKVLLLDEATSGLDHHTDEIIQALIRKEFADWTIVVVAHRLKTIADFDKVVVLQDGKIAECDKPSTLLERGGLFKSLWDLQEA